MPPQKCAAMDKHNLSRENKQENGTRNEVVLYRQEELRYMGLLCTMDSSLGESLQVRGSRESSKGVIVVGVCNKPLNLRQKVGDIFKQLMEGSAAQTLVLARVEEFLKQHRLGKDKPAGKAQVDSKLSLRKPCSLMGKVAISILSCMNRSIASSSQRRDYPPQVSSQ